MNFGDQKDDDLLLDEEDNQANYYENDD